MKTNIKIQLTYLLLFCLLAILIQSCQKDWLEPKPLSIYVPENVYVDNAGMEGSLLALREGLRTEIYGGSRMLCSELFSSDISICGSEVDRFPKNWNTQMTPTAVYDDVLTLKFWPLSYSQIRNANVIISRIDDLDIKEQDKNKIKAEAFFFRAFWYYRLINQFGNVPFINKEHTAPKLDFYSHSRNTILNKIQADLEFAVQWLPDVVDHGKVNRAAGNHLLTKVYLANLQFDKAISSASAVINDGIHSL